jgi:hypothetical protein
MKVSTLQVLEVIRQLLDWVKQTAAVVEGLEGMTNEQKAEYCANIAADEADERIKLPFIFESVDGPILRLVLKPVFADLFAKMYPESPPA